MYAQNFRRLRVRSTEMNLDRRYLARKEDDCCVSQRVSQLGRLCIIISLTYMINEHGHRPKLTVVNVVSHEV